MFYYVSPGGTGPLGFGIVTDRFLCTVGELASPESLTTLWDLLRGDDSHLEDALSLFAANGIAKIPSFALVELVDVSTGSIALAVRGTGDVDVVGRGIGPYTGAGAATWVEGSAQRIAGLSLGFGAAAGTGALPLLRGVVRTDRLIWRPEGAPVVVSSRPIGVALDEMTADDHTELPDWARQVATPPAFVSTPVLAAPYPSEPAIVQPDDDLEEADHTVVMSSRRGPQAAEPEDRTVLAGPRPRNAVASNLPPFELVFSNGSAVDLGRTVLVGRKPKVPVGRPIRLVTVSSPTSEVSGNHVEFSAVDGGVLVRDANSTNGSVVRQPGRPPYLLHGGESLTVVAGSEVDLGDSNIVSIRAL